MAHKGFALIDVISPCVTFNNNDESYKSYGYVKENEVTLHMPDYIPQRMPIEEVEVPEGHYVDITLHDGSTIRLETIDAEHDPSDAVAALAALHKADSEHHHVTGLLYFDGNQPTMHEVLGLPETALVDLDSTQLRPSEAALESVIAAFRDG